MSWLRSVLSPVLCQGCSLSSPCSSMRLSPAASKLSTDLWLRSQALLPAPHGAALCCRFAADMIKESVAFAEDYIKSGAATARATLVEPPSGSIRKDYAAEAEKLAEWRAAGGPRAAAAPPAASSCLAGGCWGITALITAAHACVYRSCMSQQARPMHRCRCAADPKVDPAGHKGKGTQDWIQYTARVPDKSGRGGGSASPKGSTP